MTTKKEELGGMTTTRPIDTPGAQAWHAQLDFERRLGELRAAAAAVSDAQLAKLAEHERRLIIETRAHLAEYDRAAAPPDDGAARYPDLPPDPPDDDHVCPQCGLSARTHRDGQCQL